MPQEWKEAYEVGMFTEFMEQRAPGHTALDGKVYKYGLLDLKERIRKELDGLDFMNDPEATDKQEELTAMSVSCDAAIPVCRTTCGLADEMSLTEKKIRNGRPSCAVSPKFAARFRHMLPRLLGGDPDVLVRPLRNDHRTERLGRDESRPFRPASGSVLRKGIADGTLTRDEAKELMSCFFIKVNNHTAPPKVGITAKESGTYNDFTNLNIGGVKPMAATG